MNEEAKFCITQLESELKEAHEIINSLEAEVSYLRKRLKPTEPTEACCIDYESQCKCYEAELKEKCKEVEELRTVVKLLTNHIK